DHVLRHWRATEWTKRNFAYFYHYNHNTGNIEVKESGLYFIYSQLYLSNMLSLCHFSTDSKLALIRSCSTSGVTVLRRGQTVSIGSSYRDIQVLMKPRLSYWGMIKLGN
ncbi:hypothetical protein NP493_1417g00043, partial [Ridgeia piscesae]